MGIVGEIFDKITYESEEFKEIQKEEDRLINQLAGAMNTSGFNEEEFIDRVRGIVYCAQKQAFTLGMRYGLEIQKEGLSFPENIDHL
ncbi:MAG: hypothetical protein IJ794_06050 [Lachnospiraceae bacterium]|nr:hypothetical protein [Lachnospiraceae bacterium]